MLAGEHYYVKPACNACLLYHSALVLYATCKMFTELKIYMKKCWHTLGSFKCIMDVVWSLHALLSLKSVMNFN